MITYMKQPFNPVSGNVVVEGNCQGIMALTSHQRWWQKAFPKSYSFYLSEVVRENVVAGELLLCPPENGVINTILITAEKIIGVDKDPTIFVEYLTDDVVKVLCELYQGDPSTFYCPIINRHTKAFASFTKAVARYGHEHEWVIFTK